jgi:hypothetical protein
MRAGIAMNFLCEREHEAEDESMDRADVWAVARAISIEPRPLDGKATKLYLKRNRRNQADGLNPTL